MFRMPRHGTVVAYAALAVALGGVGAATTTTFMPAASVSRVASSTTLPSGQSESGMFSAASVSGSGGYLGAGITFTVPLATALPNSHIVDVHGTSATHCPGAGRAAKGYLCLYDRIRYDVTNAYMYSSTAGYFSTPSHGVVVYWPVAGSGDPYAGGEWTVTAP